MRSYNHAMHGSITSDSDEERAVLARAKSGSIDAFEQILFAYEKQIFSYLFRHTGHREEAEDLTQDTFLKAYSHIKTIDLGKSFRAWLYAIATNTLYDWLRRRRARPELFSLNDPARAVETIDQSGPYESMERADAVERALLKLKPEYRTVLLLHYTHELRYSDIARALNMPVNTVKTSLRRAKIAFKQNYRG